MRRVLYLVLSLCWAGGVLAESRYVSDQFNVTMRAGQGTSHKIVQMLSSGDELELMKSFDNGYAQVKTKDGKVGYVLTRFLMDEPSARERLATMEQQLKELKAEPDKVAGRLASLQVEHAKLQKDHTGLQADKSRIEQEFEEIKRVSSDVVSIANERMELRKQVAALVREVEELKQENLELDNSEQQRWFLIGAGVLIGGLLLGLILPNLRVQRRQSNWSSL